MDGTIQEYTLEMGADTKANVLEVKQCDTNSRKARIKLVAFDKPWIIPFGCQIHINVRKTDGTLANAVCARVDESTVMAPITEQMTTVTGTQLGELYFLGSDGDIKSQTFPIVVRPMIMDQARMESSDDFQSLQGALRQVQISTDMADAATQYATAQGDRAGAAAQSAEDAAASIQVAVDAAAAAKVSESNAKTSEAAAAQTQQEVTDYVEAQKAAFVGYSQRESDSKYANALTATTTGEGGVTVDDAWTAPVLGLDVVGKSEQVATTGAQLQPFGYDTITHVGVTLTIKNDLVSLLGTATYSGGRNTLKLPDVTLQAGSYTISVSDAINAVMAVTDDANSVIVQGANIKELKFNIVKETSIHIGFNVISGNVYNITGLRIMLNAGDTALPWEPYTGGAPSPSPEYPQDIISVGTVSTGAQLLDTASYEVGTFNDSTGEANASTNTYRWAQYIPVMPGSTLYFSKHLCTYYYTDTKEFISCDISSNILQRKVPLTAAYVRFRTFSADFLTFSHKDYMLNTGDTALPWEPYTGGKPSPSVEYPQTLEVGMVGANLLNLNREASGSVSGVDFTMKNGEITLNGTASIGSGIFLFGKSFAGDEVNFTLSDGIYSASGYPQSTKLYFYRVGDSASAIVVTSGMTFTIGNANNDFVSVSLRWSTGAVFNNEKFKVMLNAGDKPKSWEPYRSASATITLTEPLRGIGEYRDRIMYRDGAWGIERSFIQLTFNGSEKWGIGSTSTTGKNRFVLSETVIKHEQVASEPINIMCDRLKAGSSSNTYSCIERISSSVGGSIAIYLEDFSSGDVDAFKAYLSTHPISAIFERAAPTWEPLPAATQQALNELTTYAGTTHLTITAGGLTPDITLEYVQDTQKAIEQHDTANRQYTDNQIAAIVAALPTAAQAAIVDNQTTKLLQEV